MVESRNFLGETPDERRNRRREALIDAALNLVSSGGLPAIGVRSVTSEAKLSSRYFYESFTDSDDLLVAALHGVAAELLEVGIAGLEAAELADPKTASESELLQRFRQGLDAALSVLFDDPRKAALIVAASAGGSRIRQELQQLILVVATAITEHQNATDIGFDYTSALFVAGGTAQLTIAYVSGELPVERGELVDRLARYSLGVITTSRHELLGAARGGNSTSARQHEVDSNRKAKRRRA